MMYWFILWVIAIAAWFYTLVLLARANKDKRLTVRANAALHVQLERMTRVAGNLMTHLAKLDALTCATCGNAINPDDASYVMTYDGRLAHTTCIPGTFTKHET